MKTFILLLCVSTLSLSTIRSEDACCESKAASVQAKLRDIDLNCLLAKYEELQTAKAKAEVQFVLLEADAKGHETEMAAVARRIDLLAVHARDVRQEIEAMTKEVSKLAATDAK